MHTDAHVTQLMLKSRTGHETVPSLGQTLTSAGGFVFSFWFLTHLGSFTGSHSELSHLSVCHRSSLICRCSSCCCCCHLSELGRVGYALLSARRRGCPCLQNDGSADTFIHSLGENREVSFSSAHCCRMTQGRISYQGSPRSMGGDRMVT